MSTITSVSAVALVLAFGSGVAAQDPMPHPPDATRPSLTFRTSASLVALNVTVMEGEKLVTGLGREQFEVYEDGVQQQVRFFESSSVPLDLILLLDASASMSARMPVVHDAARAFMKVLRPGDRGAVVAFNEHVKVLQGLTGDRAAIEAAIGSAAASGSTALHNALYVALKEFGRSASDAGDVRRQAIAVLSDGEDTASLVTFEDVVALARGFGVNVYTIGVQASGSSARGKAGAQPLSQGSYTLTQLARETGARAFFPSGVHELKGVYSSIAHELKAQYSIAYAPGNGRPDGRFRRILVRIPTNPALQPRTRTGYTANAARDKADSLGGQSR